MKRILLAGLFGIAAATSASAAGYDDFAKGVAARNRGDFDTALAAFSSALAAGDLAPGLQPTAHFDRALAYLFKRQCDLALSDANATIQLKPDYSEAYLVRASAQSCLGHADAAIADLSDVIAKNPATEFYVARGHQYWAVGRFAEAGDDFAEAAKRDSGKPYYVLWLAISKERAGNADPREFATLARKLDLDDWPEPLLEFYLGKATADDVFRAAARGDGQAPINQKCEANFYIAEWQLAHGNADAAKPLLQEAVNNCPKNFVEFGAAEVELKRLH